MANIGNLSFGIGGDDKELRKILDERKKDAIELQKLLSSFDLGGKNSNSQLTDTVRKQEKLNRLEQSNLRLQETRDRVAAGSLVSQQRVNQAAERTRTIQLQNLRLDNDRITSEQRVRTEVERTEAVRRRSAAEVARIEQERIGRERLNNQRLLTEEQRTQAARIRAARMAVQGQDSLNKAFMMTNKTLFSQKVLLSQLSNQLGAYFSIYMAGSFVKELAKVSGEFEKQRLSLAAILQNKEAADKIFGQIKDLAVYSPFNFKELTDYAKQLSAFSIPTDELFDTMKRLADISAGLGVDMRRIILAYGQVRSAAVLRGQELRQFTEAGIPLVDELAKKFTKLNGEVVSTGEVFDKISNREVPFQMIKEIFTEMTSEGGKFYQMQEVQATSLAGMISNLRDAYDIMLDSIGEANRGMLKGFVGGLVEVMDNWEKYWRILSSIIATYGVYKASLAVIASMQKYEGTNIIKSTLALKAKEAAQLRQISLSRSLTIQEQIRLNTANILTTADLRSLVVSGQINKSMALRMIASKQMTVAQAGHLKVLLGLTRAEIAGAAAMTGFGRAALYAKNILTGFMTSLKALALNPYTWILTAIGGILYAYQTWSDYNEKLEESTRDMADSVLGEYAKIRGFFQKESAKIKVTLDAGSEEDIKREILKLKEKLQEYGAFGLQIISKAEGGVDKDGNEVKGIEDSTEKLKYYESALQDIEKAYRNVLKYPGMFIDANDKLGGILRDNLSDELKDLDDITVKYEKKQSSLNKLSSIYLDYANELIQSKKATGDFAKSLQEIVDKGGTAAEVLKAINKYVRQQDVYTYRPKEFPSGTLIAEEVTEWRHALYQLENAQKSYTEKLDKFIADIKSRHEFKDVDWTKPLDKTTEMMIRIYSENFIKNLDKVSENVKQEFLNKTIPVAFNFAPEINLAPLEKQSELQKTVDSVFNNLKDNLGVKAETIRPSFETGISDYVKDMQSGIEDDTKRVTEINNILKSDSLTPELKDYWERQKNNTEATKQIRSNILSGLGQPLTKKEKSQPKDRFTEGLKRQVEIVKSAKKEYDKLRKLMSAEDAFAKIGSIDEYKGIKQSDMTDNGYVDYLKSKVSELDNHIRKTNSDTAKNVRTTWNKELGTIQIEYITKEAEKELDKIEKYLSQYKEKYKLYEQVFDITGDKGKAAQLVFGDASASAETYIDAMKSKLKEMSGGGKYEDLIKLDHTTLPEQVKKMVEEIGQAIQEKDFSVKIDMSKIIADYATTEEKITAIHNQYEAKREEARNSGNSEAEINKALAAYDKAEAEAVTGLREELWQLTPFYRQLFGDLSDISYRHLKKMAAEAKETVIQIANTRIDPDDEDSRLKYGKYDRNGKLEGYYMPDANGDISDVLINLKQYERLIAKIASIQKDMRKENPFDSLLRPLDKYKIAEGTDQEKQMPLLDIIASKAKDLNEIVQELSGSFSSMFDALGNGGAADATAFIGEMVGAATNVATGIASGNPVQVISGIVGGITSIAKMHDKKLDRAIEKSKVKVKELQGAYTELERFLERQLGAVTQNQAKEQIKNLEKQKKEIQSQLRNEEKKKKTDKGAVADYKNQINELNDKIRYFYEDLAGEQFGIKIKDWAKNISDALVEAWAKGEDAAKAFDNTVADIMKNVFKNVLQKEYVERSMGMLRNILFGSDGQGGVLGDGVLSQSDMGLIVSELSSLKNNLGQWKNAWDILTQAAKQAGIDLEEITSKEKDTLSKGIEAVTEDTASLLASYINAMRADLSMQLSFVGRILACVERDSNSFALMQADIMLIQMNTLRTANNTDRLVELSEGAYSILRSASISGSGVKFNIN